MVKAIEAWAAELRALSEVDGAEGQPVWSARVVDAEGRDGDFFATDHFSDYARLRLIDALAQNLGNSTDRLVETAVRDRVLARLCVRLTGGEDAAQEAYDAVCAALANDFDVGDDDDVLDALLVNGTHLLFPRLLVSRGVRWALGVRPRVRGAVDFEVEADRYPPHPATYSRVYRCGAEPVVLHSFRDALAAMGDEECFFAAPNEEQRAAVVERQAYVRFSRELNGSEMGLEAGAREIDAEAYVTTAIDPHDPRRYRFEGADDDDDGTCVVVDASNGGEARYEVLAASARELLVRVPEGSVQWWLFNAAGDQDFAQWRSSATGAARCLRFDAASGRAIDMLCAPPLMPLDSRVLVEQAALMRALPPRVRAPAPFPLTASDEAAEEHFRDMALEFVADGHVRVDGRCGGLWHAAASAEVARQLRAMLPAHRGVWLREAASYERRLVVRVRRELSEAEEAAVEAAMAEGRPVTTVVDVETEARTLANALMESLKDGGVVDTSAEGVEQMMVAVTGLTEAYVVFECVYEASLAPPLNEAASHAAYQMDVGGRHGARQGSVLRARVVDKWPAHPTLLDEGFPATWKRPQHAPRLRVHDTWLGNAAVAPAPMTTRHWPLLSLYALLGCHGAPVESFDASNEYVRHGHWLLHHRSPHARYATRYYLGNGGENEDESEAPERLEWVGAGAVEQEWVVAGHRPQRWRTKPRPVAEQVLGAHGLVHVDRSGLARVGVGGPVDDFESELLTALDGDEQVTHEPPTRDERLPELRYVPLTADEMTRPHLATFVRDWTMVLGPMGAGKTTRVVQFIRSLPPTARCLYVTGRRILLKQTLLATRAAAEAEGDAGDPAVRFVHYKDDGVNEFDATETRAIFTTIHSMFNFVGGGARSFFDSGQMRRYTYVIVFDEICGVLLGDFQSEKVIHPESVEKALQVALAVMAKQVVLVDAFLSAPVVLNLMQRVEEGLKLAEVFADETRWGKVRRFHLRFHRATCNLIADQQREAHFFVGYYARMEMAVRVRDEIRRGGRVAMFFASVAACKAMRRMLDTLLMGAGETPSLTFTGAEKPVLPANCTLGMHMRDQGIRLFYYTTAAGNGVDVSLFDERGEHMEYFTMLAMFGAGSPHLSFLDIVQASGRVRCVGRVLVQLDGRAPPPALLMGGEFAGVMQASRVGLLAEAARNVRSEARLRRSMNVGSIAAHYLAFVNNEAVAIDNSAYTELLVLGALHRRLARNRAAMLLSAFAANGYETRLWRVTKDGVLNDPRAAEGHGHESLKRVHTESEMAELAELDEQVAQQVDATVREREWRADMERVAREMGLSERSLVAAAVTDMSPKEREMLNEARTRQPHAFRVYRAVQMLTDAWPVSEDEWRDAVCQVTRQYASTALIEERGAAMEAASQLDESMGGTGVGAVRRTAVLALRSRAGAESTIIMGALTLYALGRATRMVRRGDRVPLVPAAGEGGGGGEGEVGCRVASKADEVMASVVPNLSALRDTGRVSLTTLREVMETYYEEETRMGGLLHMPARFSRGRDGSTSARTALGRACRAVMGIAVENVGGKVTVRRDSQLAMFGALYARHHPDAGDEAREFVDGILETVREAERAAAASPPTDSRALQVRPGDAASTIRKKKRVAKARNREADEAEAREAEAAGEAE